MGAPHRTAVEVGADILETLERFRAHDRRGQLTEAADDYADLDDLLEEYGRIPKQRSPHT